MNGRNSIVPSRPNSNGADLEDRRGDQRDGEQADLRPELADRLGGPQLQEVGMAEDGCVGGRHRRPSVRRRCGTRRAGAAAIAGELASAACWSNRVPNVSEGRRLDVVDRLADGARPSVPGVLPARPDERREPQPLRVHHRRRARARCREALERLVGAAHRRDRHGRRTRASTRGSARSTSSRSSRSATRRWTPASSWRAHSARGSRRASTCRSTSTRRRRRAPTG